MQRAKKKLFQFLQLHLKAKTGEGSEEGIGKKGRGVHTSMLSLFACSMQCLCLPLLLQVNLPHGLNLLTVCEGEGEGERGRQKEKEKKNERERGRGRQTLPSVCAGSSFPRKQVRFSTSFSGSARKVLISLHTRHKLHM